jgi:hypothetical protein
LLADDRMADVMPVARHRVWRDVRRPLVSRAARTVPNRASRADSGR